MKTENRRYAREVAWLLVLAIVAVVTPRTAAQRGDEFWDVPELNLCQDQPWAC